MRGFRPGNRCIVRPAVCDEEGLRSRVVHGGADLHGDDKRPGVLHAQGHLLRAGPRDHDCPLHAYGDEAPLANADRVLLRGRSRAARSLGDLRCPGDHREDGPYPVHRLPARLDRPGGGVYCDGDCHGDPPGRAVRNAVRAGQADLLPLCQQGVLGGSAGNDVLSFERLQRLPDRALLGAEVGERNGGSDVLQARDGPGAMHVPGGGLPAPDRAPHVPGVPL